MRKREFLLGVAALLAAACATPPPKGRADLLEFIQDGRTTRDDVYVRLGTPVRVFEKERIASWLFGKDDVGYTPVSSARWGRYELVIVFDTNDIVVRHSVVELRAR